MWDPDYVNNLMKIYTTEFMSNDIISFKFEIMVREVCHWLSRPWPSIICRWLNPQTLCKCYWIANGWWVRVEPDLIVAGKWGHWEIFKLLGFS